MKEFFVDLWSNGGNLWNLWSRSNSSMRHLVVSEDRRRHRDSKKNIGHNWANSSSIFIINKIKKGIRSVCVCVFISVCVCERERERKIDR